MSSLIVRNVDEQLVARLKERAARHKHSAEAEHRLILRDALTTTNRRSLADVLAAMPNVGLDADFKRLPADDAPHVFD